MHYLGMSAVELPGHVAWDLKLVLFSIVVGLLLGMGAFAVAVQSKRTSTLLVSALLLTLAIVSHHFTAMGAVEIAPDPTRVVTALSLSPGSLAIAVASIAVAILGMSLIAAFADRRLDDKALLLDTALNNMTQGIVMFDGAGQLVVCNTEYCKMYGLPADLGKSGSTLLDIIQFRIKSGSLQGDPAQYCSEVLNAINTGKTTTFLAEAPDGRTISVVNKPIPGGAYWVGTHDDITERRVAERRSASAAEQESRRAVIDSAISSFRESIEAALRTVAASTAEMKDTANALSASSNETSRQATDAVHTSRQAAQNVQSAAGAAEELSKSISEIGDQLTRAGKIVGATTNEVQATNQDIARLDRAAQKIGDVIKLIQSVADQTNLLALNATIEAARAGEAGRGFSVVASEVKSLAVQTRKATEEIASQITEVQSSTQSAVDAIQRITDRMREIEQYSLSIGSSVEEQNAVTSAIAENVAGAASGTRSVVDVLQRVSTVTSNMHNSASVVLKASQDVEASAITLRKGIDDFLCKVAS
jgi:PAS domain-containing protein